LHQLRTQDEVVEVSDDEAEFGQTKRVPFRGKPNGHGAIIVDEVQMVGRLCFQSSNNTVVGFCDPLESYQDLKDLFQPAPAALSDPLPLSRYATQFMFRDLSSGFEP